VRLLLLLLTALFLTRDAPSPPRIAAPALWVLHDADTTIYLFGTVHMLPRDLDWNRGPVRQGFDKSDTLVTELVLPPRRGSVRPRRHGSTARSSRSGSIRTCSIMTRPGSRACACRCFRSSG
jgi:uncharacterized protein YbaP (TraB family)